MAKILIGRVLDKSQDSVATYEKHTLVDEEFDYIGVAYPSTGVEVYTYRNGGSPPSSGTIVATVTVTYASGQLQSVERT